MISFLSLLFVMLCHVPTPSLSPRTKLELHYIEHRAKKHTQSTS